MRSRSDVELTPAVTGVHTEVGRRRPGTQGNTLLSLPRYLRAVKWVSSDEAIKRLEGTLKWRREFEIYEMSADDIKEEVRGHCLSLCCLVMRVR
jgi:hypothetical protein